MDHDQATLQTIWLDIVHYLTLKTSSAAALL